MKTSSNIALDSNILIYAYNSGSPYHQPAYKLLKNAKAGKINACIAAQNALEFYAVITRTNFKPKPATPSKAKNMLFNYLYSSSLSILTPKTNTIMIFGMLLEKLPAKKGNHIFDLYLAATFLSYNIHTIYTVNTKDFSGVKDFTAINPFGN